MQERPRERRVPLQARTHVRHSHMHPLTGVFMHSIRMFCPPWQMSFMVDVLHCWVFLHSHSFSPSEFCRHLSPPSPSPCRLVSIVAVCTNPSDLFIHSGRGEDVRQGLRVGSPTGPAPSRHGLTRGGGRSSDTRSQGLCSEV